MNIAIIGAGISGMSSALELVNAGHTVTILAKAFTPHITSDRAAAFWLPYHVRNDQRGIRWCHSSYERYRQWSEHTETGISMHRLVKVVADDQAVVDRSWKDFMPEGSFTPLSAEALMPGYVEGDEAIVPLIETQIFLPWLQQQLADKGVMLLQREITSLEALSSFDCIVNCAGMGARSLCNDEALVPYRGQVALLSPRHGLPIFLDNEKPQYIVPRKDAIIIGGTYEANVWEATTEPETIAFLLEQAYRIYPELQQQSVLGSWAGLRPYRELVRVEREGNIIHNYGHGGSGFTLAFGCAEEVLQMVNEL